jgi:glycosyltransferase involved in cell wall biosynthesis
MACELPLVAADIPVFREIGADAAVYADPHCTEALTEAMARVLGSASLREEIVARGRERLREFSWSRSAERHLALFRSVV